VLPKKDKVLIKLLAEFSSFWSYDWGPHVPACCHLASAFHSLLPFWGPCLRILPMTWQFASFKCLTHYFLQRTHLVRSVPSRIFSLFISQSLLISDLIIEVISHHIHCLFHTRGGDYRGHVQYLYIYIYRYVCVYPFTLAYI
jgi:hypothetical protein